MHILVTADTAGGVWTFVRELVTGLTGRGVQVTLVSFGDFPSPGQKKWMEPLRNLDYHPTTFKLEWMQDSAADMEVSAEFLRDIIRRTKPDLIHFNQFYYGALDCEVPRVVVAHSDVVSWWMAVHGETPPQTSWLDWYRHAVMRGLAGATAVVAPSQWMLDQVERYYLKPNRPAVIYNGRTPALFNPSVTKEQRIMTAGRLWDQGKNIGLLLAAEMPAPVEIMGARGHGRAQSMELSARKAGPNVHFRPQRDEQQMAKTLARTAIYAAPSLYEPFGLAPVEAAFSRCALVVSDIPSFRELWEDAAVYFRSNDPGELRQALELLVGDPWLRWRHANLAYKHALRKFSAARMTDDYMNLYRAVAPAAVAAA
ncbi:MAG TPA: glycosyltransferase family 4 protein [Candidatus Angelobacter sp.]